jgi:hypothetical protein
MQISVLAVYMAIFSRVMLASETVELDIWEILILKSVKYAPATVGHVVIYRLILFVLNV